MQMRGRGMAGARSGGRGGGLRARLCRGRVPGAGRATIGRRRGGRGRAVPPAVPARLCVRAGGCGAAAAPLQVSAGQPRRDPPAAGPRGTPRAGLVFGGGGRALLAGGRRREARLRGVPRALREGPRGRESSGVPQGGHGAGAAGTGRRG